MAFDVPASCTLPTVEQPVRLGEFEALLATALRGRERIGDRHLQLAFDRGEGIAATVRDLAARESECCSFFDFTVTTTDDRVLLDVVVPAERVDVLDGLVEMARLAVPAVPDGR